MKTGLLGFGLSWLIDMGFSALEQKQLNDYLTKFSGFSAEKQKQEIERIEKHREKAFSRTQGIFGAFNNIITVGGLLGANQDKDMVRYLDAKLKAMYQITGETYPLGGVNDNEYKEIDIKKYDPNDLLGNTENDYERDAPKHYHQFVDACLGKDKVSAPFSYSSRLTETILLGVIAGRFPNKTLHWNNEKAKFQEEEANQYLTGNYRDF